MSSWFEKGRPALFEALSAVCKQIDHDLTAELVDGRNQATSGVNNVAEASGGTSGAGPQADTAEVSLSRAEGQRQPPSLRNSDRNWKAEYTKLSAKFNALSGNFKKAREALQRRKDERDRWINHAAVLEKKIRAVQEEHGIQILDLSSPETRASSHIDHASGKVRTTPDTSFSSDGGDEHVEVPTPPKPVAPVTTASTRPSSPPRDAPHPDSTQSSSGHNSDEALPPLPQDVAPVGVKIKSEPSSDGAVFVSERSLGKRKREEERPEARAVVIKTEPSNGGSSPSLSFHRCDFNPHESPDLGDVAQTMYTPRKRREMEQRHQSHEATDSNSPLAAHTPQLVTGVAAVLAGQPLVPTSTHTPLGLDRRLSSTTTAKKGGRSFRRGLGHGIGVLAEDGRSYEMHAEASPLTGAHSINPAIKGRLGSLLDMPSREENHVIVPPATRRAHNPPLPAQQDDLSIPKPRELPFEKMARQSNRSPGIRTPQAQRTPLADATNTWRANKSVQKSSKPPGSLLRNKPLSALRLEDFRINPQVNDGHDFAYSEVVRDKDDRACLPGCIDMHCCGKEFRALALSQRPNPPLTGAQRQEEQKLLEEYLGDLSYRLATMPKEERDELWVEAKMRELANKYGKHRHRFSRMRSPPGFWNADFPSTQELETEKAEAAKRERQTLQDRYREALRPGGRWVFRDE